METANVFSDPIEVQEASNAHIEYLKNGPHVFLGDGRIVHSMFVDRDDLRTLYNNGTGGMRLYFSRKKDDKGREVLSIICAPVNMIFENVLVGLDGKTALVDNLEPCPDKCKKNDSLTSPTLDNSEMDLNFNRISEEKMWCKPNLETNDGKIWFDVTGNPVQ